MKFSLKNSIYLGVFIPTIMMLFFSLYTLNEEYKRYRALQMSERYVSCADALKNLIVKLGEERGMSAIVFALPKNETSYQVILEQKRAAFDKALRSYQMLSKTLHLDQELHQQIELSLKKIEKTRIMIDKKECASIERFFFGVYTQLENQLLAVQAHIIEHVPAAIQNEYTNTMYLSNMIASSGIVRGYISYYLSKHKPLSLQTSTEILLHYYHSLKIVRNTLSNYKIDYLDTQEIHHIDTQIQNYISLIQRANMANVDPAQRVAYPLEAIEWFDVWTKKISYLERANKGIEKDIQEKYVVLKDQASFTMGWKLAFGLISLVVVVFSLRITAMINRHITLLSQTLEKLTPFQKQSKKIDLQSKTGIDDALVLIADTIEHTQQATRSKEQFLANMSHELRTPLNAIIGFAQILEKKDQPLEEAKLFAQKIRISGQELLKLVDTILDFANIISGKTKLYPTEVGVAFLFAEVQCIIDSMAEQKGVVLRVKQQTGVVHADPFLFKSALLHLLSNAVKFTPQGKKITLEYRYEGRHIFSVCDEGYGIADEKLEAVFEPFVQLKNEQNITPQGSGLGLAITQEIVALHGGEIVVHSTVGTGTCVYVYLQEENKKGRE